MEYWDAMEYSSYGGEQNNPLCISSIEPGITEFDSAGDMDFCISKSAFERDYK